MSTKDVSILSSILSSSCLIEKKAINTTQMSLNSQGKVSGKEFSQKSRITSIEINKLASFKAREINPTLSSLKTSRKIEAKRVLATSTHQKETNSMVTSEQSMEIQGPKASKDDHLTDSGDKQKPFTSFLTRTTIEGSKADLTSLRSAKRLSQSPSKSRNSKESSEEVIVQVESKSNNLICYHPTSGLESPSDIQVTEIEVPDSVLMEDNSSIEKGEAYMKELEDICYMLKKKHEETEELVVRAIVNNNLMMLNHPIHEEKIRKVRKFASQLMYKGIQT